MIKKTEIIQPEKSSLGAERLTLEPAEIKAGEQRQASENIREQIRERVSAVERGEAPIVDSEIVEQARRAVTNETAGTTDQKALLLEHYLNLLNGNVDLAKSDLAKSVDDFLDASSNSQSNSDLK